MEVEVKKIIEKYIKIYPDKANYNINVVKYMGNMHIFDYVFDVIWALKLERLMKKSTYFVSVYKNNFDFNKQNYREYIKQFKNMEIVKKNDEDRMYTKIKHYDHYHINNNKYTYHEIIHVKNKYVLFILPSNTLLF